VDGNKTLRVIARVIEELARSCERKRNLKSYCAKLGRRIGNERQTYYSCDD
jgi:hypothetical protein